MASLSGPHCQAVTVLCSRHCDTMVTLQFQIADFFVDLWSCKKNFLKQKYNFFSFGHSLSEYLLPVTDKKHFLTQCSFISNRASPSFC